MVTLFNPLRLMFLQTGWSHPGGTITVDDCCASRKNKNLSRGENSARNKGLLIWSKINTQLNGPVAFLLALQCDFISLFCLVHHKARHSIKLVKYRNLTNFLN